MEIYEFVIYLKDVSIHRGAETQRVDKSELTNKGDSSRYESTVLPPWLTGAY